MGKPKFYLSIIMMWLGQWGMWLLYLLLGSIRNSTGPSWLVLDAIPIHDLDDAIGKCQNLHHEITQPGSQVGSKLIPCSENCHLFPRNRRMHLLCPSCIPDALSRRWGTLHPNSSPPPDSARWRCSPGAGFTVLSIRFEIQRCPFRHGNPIKLIQSSLITPWYGILTLNWKTYGSYRYL